MSFKQTGHAFAPTTTLLGQPLPRNHSICPRRRLAVPRRRPRGTAVIHAVFIWSNDFEDDMSGDDEQEDSDNQELSGDSDSNYDEPVFGDSWRRPRSANGDNSGMADGLSGSYGGNGMGGVDGVGDSSSGDHVGSGPVDGGNLLYASLREHTSGPDDVDRLRARVTESAADAFRRIVTGILGTIPGDTYEVVITSDRGGISRLMQSSLSTGYALRNAEFRMILNEAMATQFSSPQNELRGPLRDLSGDKRETTDRESSGVKDLFTSEPDYMRHVPRRGKVDASAINGSVQWWDSEREVKQEMNGPDYVAKLEAENELLRERLAATQIHDSNNNKLMDFMRTLNPEKIAALQANLNPDAVDAFKRVVKGVLGELSPGKVQMTYSTNRDYLGQLTFWCLLVGYCIRNLEKRLEMTKIFESTEAFAESSVRDADK